MSKQWWLGALGAALLTLTPSLPASAQVKPTALTSGVDRPASAIYIGNSFFYYNNSLHNHVAQLLRAADPAYRFRSTSVTISGSGSDWHDVGSYFRPNAIGRYSFDANNNIVFNKIDRLFDLAIMMDCSQCPVHPELRLIFFEQMKQHAATVRKHGAKPVFFMSWAYADAPEMTVPLADAYTTAANDNDAFVIPAGLAFARAVKQRPALNLYVADKRHPSLAGTYLTAATTYGALFRNSPVGLKYTAGLDQETTAFLQSVAWQTLQDYLTPSGTAARN
jgi:hypothetical protein